MHTSCTIGKRARRIFSGGKFIAELIIPFAPLVMGAHRGLDYLLAKIDKYGTAERVADSG